jgi:hypothetical protein
VTRLFSRRLPAWLALSVVVASVAAGGIAYASIPSSSGLVQGCYSANGAKGTGGTELKIVDSDSASCSRGQTAVSLNAVPPQSFVQVGQFCSSGRVLVGINSNGSLACAVSTPKAFGTTIETGELDGDAFFIPIGSLSLPSETKTYFVSAHIGVQNVGETSRWQCHLREGSAGGVIFDEAQTVTTGNGLVTDGAFAADVSLQSIIRVTNGSVWVTCTSGTNSGNRIHNARIDAVEVTAG